MPVVPSSPLPSVAPTVASQPRAPLEAFGGGAAARPIDLSAAGRAALRIYQDQKAKADQIAVTDAGAQVSALETSLLYDQHNGALTKRGRNALGVHEQVATNWSKGVADITGSLANDEQKAAVQRLVQSHWSSLNEQLERHVAQERRAYDDTSTAAYLANEGNAAIASYADPARVETSIANQRAAIMDHAQRNGMSADWIQEHTAAAASTTRLGVLEQYLNGGQDLTASRYLEQHRDDFVGRDLQRAEQLTEAGSVRGESQRQADTITSSATSLSEALKAVDRLDDPRVRDATETRVRRVFADRAADERQQREGAFARASATLEQTKGDVDRIPLSDRVLLTPAENDELERRANNIRHPKVVTNEATFANLINLSALNDATRKQFAELDLRDPKYREQLSDADYHHILEVQRSVRNGIDRADAADQRRGDRAVDVVHRREETAVVKQLDVRARQAEKDKAAAALAQKMGITGLATPAPAARVVLPQWMIDSAKTNPDYAEYLKLHGADLNQKAPVSPTVPTGGRPKAPGAPITPPPAGINFGTPPSEDNE